MAYQPKIRIGPAGSDGLGPLKGVEKVASLGLECMEVEFTYGVRLKPDAARAVGRLAREKGIRLSVHAHFSGIEFGPKGEKKHRVTAPDFFKPLAVALLKRGVSATLICESPQPYTDALMMQEVVSRLQTP